MANFVDCYSNGFGWLTLLGYLFNEEQSLALAETGQYAFRIVEKTADRDAAPISCNTMDSLLELFHRSLETADDGKPALRVVITNRANGAALEDVPNCTDYESLEFLARNTFIMTDEGDVAVNLANIT